MLGNESKMPRDDIASLRGRASQETSSLLIALEVDFDTSLKVTFSMFIILI